jgi:ribosomal protein S18 acetylase RimI-like enzyme
MNEILIDGSQGNLVLALEANQSAHVELYSQLPGAIPLDEPGLYGLMTGLDASESFIYHTQFSAEQAEQRIGEVVQRFREHACLLMFWQVSPSTNPSDLGKRLEACGFELLVRAPGMAIDLRTLEAAPMLNDFSVQVVRNSEQLRQWVGIVAVCDEISDALRESFYRVFNSQEWGAGMPSKLFLGMENGIAVATSRLFCAGGVAGLWHIATLPESRDRGYGTAMTLATARTGLERGYRFGVLFATSMGHGVYHRLGFQEVSHHSVYKLSK